MSIYNPTFEDGADVEFSHIFGTMTPDVERHNNQSAVVVRGLRVPEEVDEEVGPMYVIRFVDGWEMDAFAEELVSAPA